MAPETIKLLYSIAIARFYNLLSFELKLRLANENAVVTLQSETAQLALTNISDGLLSDVMTMLSHSTRVDLLQK